MADTAAALVIQLSADFKDFKRQMQSATGIFDAEGRKIAKRQAALKKQLSNWTLDFSGIKGISGALAGLTGAAVIGGIGTLIKKSLDAASAIGDTAQQAGVSVEKLQELRFAASQSGASFDIMDTALTTLNKTFGDFVNTGGGKGASAFKQLGIDKLINSGAVRDTEQAFDVIVKKVSGFSSEAQKASLLAGVFGKEAGPKLLQLVNQGADGLARLEAQAVSLGIVLSAQTVAGAKEASDKLDALFSVIKSQGVAAVASLAPEIAQLAQEITNSLPNLIQWVERWAEYFGLIKLSPIQKLQQQISDVDDAISKLLAKQTNPGLLTSLGDKLNGGAFTKQISDEIDRLQAKRESLQSQLLQAGGSNLPATPAAAAAKPKLQVAQTDAEKTLAQKRAALLAQTGVDAATASAALIVAQDQTSVQLLKGSAQYYAAVKKQIDDEYQAKVTTAEATSAKQKAELGKQGKDWKGYAEGVENINKTLNDKIAAADEERKQKQFEAGPGSLTQDAIIQGQQQIQGYEDETAALGLVAGAAAKLAFVQQGLNEARARGIPITADLIAALNAEGDAVGAAAQAANDAQRRVADNIQVTDELRQGLEDVGVAGLHGFKSIGDAAKQLLSNLTDMIIRLYVIKPLVESILGPAGSSSGGGSGGGGGFGQLLSSLFGFADGGVMTPQGPRKLKRFAGGGVSNKAAIFGEAGPEAAIPLPDGRSVPVTLRLPKAPSASRAPTIAPVIQIDARYATRGVADEIEARLRAVTPQIIAQAVRTSDARFPSNMQRANRDVF